MAVQFLLGKKSARNGNRLQEYPENGNGYQENMSDDEDDVFVDESGLEGLGIASKPLMHPRQRTKVKSQRPECKCRSLCKPVLYFLAMVGVMGGLVTLLLFLLNRHKAPAQSNTFVQTTVPGVDLLKDEIVELIGCDSVEIEDVWVVGFPKLITETAFRLVDVNQDGVLDILLGFGTGTDGYGVDDFVCDIYFNGTKPCFGGILALEGRTGRELWRHYSRHEIYALNCNEDLDGDTVLDCLGGGRAGEFRAVSSKSGRLLWSFDRQEAKNDIMNVYTPQYINDLDGDQVPEIVVSHGGDPLQEPGSFYRLSGRLLIMSGKTGKVLTWVGVPDKHETYYSPQVYLQMDATPMVLFGTGGETHSGSLWVISVNDLVKNRMANAKQIYRDKFKGVMTPPVLIDLNGDGVRDIVIAPFNSSVLAYDGHTYKLIWNFTIPMSESYSTPAAGYYNDDDTPDFLVKLAIGPGFPIYFYSETNVLDGKTGQPLMQKAIKDSVGAQASPITISMEGKGHDLFLYWIADCQEHEGQGGEFTFVKGTNVHEQSRSDFCRLRFKTALFSKVLALGRSLKPPGVTVYYSVDRRERERADWVDTAAEAQQFLRDLPEYNSLYERFNQRDKEVPQITTETQTSVNKGRRKGGLTQPNSGTEDFEPQYIDPNGAPHSPGPKKGPLFKTQSRNNSKAPLISAPPEGPEMLPRRHETYNVNPYSPADVNNPYEMTDMEEPADPSRNVIIGASDQGIYGYPFTADEYPKYYPESERRDVYDQSNKGYVPYNNYFQKRNNGDSVMESSSDLGDVPVSENLESFQSLLERALGKSVPTPVQSADQIYSSAYDSSIPNEKILSREENIRVNSEYSGKGHKHKTSLEQDPVGFFTRLQADVPHEETGQDAYTLLQGEKSFEKHIRNDDDGMTSLEVNDNEGKFQIFKPESDTGERKQFSLSKNRSRLDGTQYTSSKKSEGLGINSKRNKEINTTHIDNNTEDARSERLLTISSKDEKIVSIKVNDSNNHTNSKNNNIINDKDNTDHFGREPSYYKVNISSTHTRQNSKTGETNQNKVHNSFETNKNSAHNTAQESQNIAHNTAQGSQNTAHNTAQESQNTAHNTAQGSQNTAHNTQESNQIKVRIAEENVHVAAATNQNEAHSRAASDNSAPIRAQNTNQGRPRRSRAPKQRKSRHVGPHDDNGMQRLLSTGTLAPTLLPADHPDFSHTVDFLFGTFWFFPAKTQAILPEDQKCIADKLSKESERFDPKNKYYGMDHDAFEHAITAECLKASNHQLGDKGIFESQSTYNPFKINMGQLTVYRLRIKCTCSQSFNTTQNKRCARILPFQQQQWPAYMGKNGDSMWMPRT